jgi:hypothetical protein
LDFEGEQMKPHTKKMIAPIVISVIVVLYYITFAITCMVVDGIPLLVKLLCGILPLFIAGGSVYVLIERIKEIRSGEEDDLSKY